MQIKDRTFRVFHLVRRFWPFTTRIRRAAVGTAAIALLLPALGTALLWQTKSIVDEVFIGGKMDLLAGFAAAYLAISAVRAVATYVSTRLEASIVERIAQDIRTALFHRVVTATPGTLGSRTPGDIITHLTGDTDRVQYLVYTGLLVVFSDVAAALFYCAFLLLISWKLTLCALLILPALFVVGLRFSSRVRRASLLARKEESNWISVIEERLGALPVIHAYHTADRETRYFSTRNDRSRRAELRAVSLQASMSFLIEIIATLGAFATIALGAYEIRSGNLSVGALVAFLGSVGSMYGPIRSLAKVSGRVQRAAAAGERIAAVLDADSLVRESPRAITLENVRGHVAFENVSFAYADGQRILDDVSFSVEPGETVAIVGASGAGKSTLVRLLLRLHDPSSGGVRIDGTDIRDVSLASLADAVAPVFQEAHLLRGSIADNLRYGRTDVPLSTLKEIASACHVAPFVREMPFGYASEVGPRGSKLSGGQRQRVALARALIRKSPILILDEATASVDSETEELMQDAVARYSGRRTLIVVAHRLSSVLRADRVVVLDNGRIVEVGSPAALLAASGRCAQLFAPQLAMSREAA